MIDSEYLGLSRRGYKPLAALVIALLSAPSAPSAAYATTSDPLTTTTVTTSSCTQCTTSVSGLVSQYVKATATADGYIVIGGVRYVIKAGVSLPSLITLNSTVKLTLTLDAAGKVTTCVVTSVKVTASGLVSQYVKATATADGYIVIGGVRYVIKAGVSLPSLITLNSTVKLTLTLDAAGKVTTCVVTSVKVTASGLVSAFVPATSLTSGSLAIAGKTYVIASGTAITGVSVGLTLKLELTLNSSGQVTSCRLL